MKPSKAIQQHTLPETNSCLPLKILGAPNPLEVWRWTELGNHHFQGQKAVSFREGHLLPPEKVLAKLRTLANVVGGALPRGEKVVLATLIYRVGNGGETKKIGGENNQPITWEFVIEYFCKEMGWKLSKPQLVIRSSEPSTINEGLEWLDVFELLVEGSKVFLFISSNIYMPNLLRKWNLFTHTNQQTGSYEHEAPCDPLITWTEVFHRTSEHFDEGLDPLVVDWSSRSCRLWLENWSYWKVCSICFLVFYICIYGRYTIYNYMCVCLTLYNRFFFLK